MITGATRTPTTAKRLMFMDEVNFHGKGLTCNFMLAGHTEMEL